MRRTSRLGNPAARFQVAPGNVVLLWPDQAEDVALAAVFANERGREAEPPARLNLGSDAENGGRQQMHFVIYNQAPVTLVEDLEVREFVTLLRPPGQNLIRGQRDRANVFAFAGVLCNLVFLQVGLVEQFPFPLLHRGDAGGED